MIASIAGGSSAPGLEVHLMLLTKHEGVTFQNQTIYISGQAFVRCTFVACTLILRETVYYLEGCTFDKCNWHVDRVLLWGHPESTKEIKALIELIEAAQPKSGTSTSEAIQGEPSTDGFVTVGSFAPEAKT